MQSDWIDQVDCVPLRRKRDRVDAGPSAHVEDDRRRWRQLPTENRLRAKELKLPHARTQPLGLTPFEVVGLDLPRD